MTREEAIDIIKCLAWHTRPEEEMIEQAIKALEQEPILNKIRAEIEYKQEIQLKGEDISEWNKCIKEVLKVIDKYKAESEDDKE